MYNYKINIKALSVNQAWKGKRFKTDLYKKYEKVMLLMLPKKSLVFDGGLIVNLIFGFSSKNSDIDNPVKPLLDILQKKYKFNDSQIMELNIKKVHVSKKQEFILIEILQVKK